MHYTWPGKPAPAVEDSIPVAVRLLRQGVVLLQLGRQQTAPVALERVRRHVLEGLREVGQERLDARLQRRRAVRACGGNQDVLLSSKAGPSHGTPKTMCPSPPLITVYMTCRILLLTDFGEPCC